MRSLQGSGLLLRVVAQRRRMAAGLAIIVVPQVELDRVAAKFQMVVADAAACEQRLALRDQLARALDVRRVQRLDAEAPRPAIRPRDLEGERRRLAQQHLRVGSDAEFGERVAHQCHQFRLEAPRTELAREHEAAIAGAARTLIVAAEHRDHRFDVAREKLRARVTVAFRVGGDPGAVFECLCAICRRWRS